MYFVFQKYADALFNSRRNHINMEKAKIDEEIKISKENSQKICDCESFCEKYKIKESVLEKNTESIETPEKKSNIYNSIVGFFSNKSVSEKKPLENISKIEVEEKNTDHNDVYSEKQNEENLDITPEKKR